MMPGFSSGNAVTLNALKNEGCYRYRVTGGEVAVVRFPTLGHGTSQAPTRFGRPFAHRWPKLRRLAPGWLVGIAGMPARSYIGVTGTFGRLACESRLSVEAAG